MILGTKQIKYTKASLYDRVFKHKWKYTLLEEAHFVTSVFPKEDIKTDYITLTKTGLLLLKEGYACDGASGPTYDSKSSMRGAFVHDAFYQLMRLGLLPQSAKWKADDIFYDLCVQDGMNKIRAWVWFQAVSKFAGYACKERTK